MRVVLKRDVAGLGRTGDVKDVAEGYAKNFLLPRGLAMEASAGELKRVAQERASAKAKKERQHSEAEEVAARLGQVVLVFKLKVGPQGKAFGSVTERDVADALEKQGFHVGHERIQLGEPLRSLGAHQVEVRLAPDVRAKVTVAVEPE
ncbi:MAG: 50S ribosomal protein L9 [Chloroflexota bacterium]|nr:50S ribosomal protein L9 [Chloroflexota bacterium]